MFLTCVWCDMRRGFRRQGDKPRGVQAQAEAEGWRYHVVAGQVIWTCPDCRKKRELDDTTGMTADERAWLG